MKQTLLLVGCGDIAFRAAPLLRKHYRLLGLCRRPENYAKFRLHGIVPLSGDLDDPRSLDRFSGIAHAVLYLAPPPNHGEHDSRAAHFLAMLTKTLRTNRRILPQRVIYISTSGVYGDCGGALINETCRSNPITKRALRRIDAEKKMRHWGLRNYVNVSILRVPGIYAADRLPLTRLQAGSPAVLSEEDSYTNHIHADDLAHIVFSALRYAKPGRVYNVCDDSCLKTGEYFDLIADQFNLPRPPRVSRNKARESISASMWSFMEESRRLINFRMKHELNVKLRYLTVAEGIVQKNN